MARSFGHIAFLFFLFSSFSLFSQTRKELETQRKQIQLDIKRVNKLLVTQKRKEKNALEDLKDINLKINVRNNFINTINLEATLLSKEIKKKDGQVDKLSKNLEVLKKDYADMIYKSYKSRSLQSRTMFLLSAQNFYQAYKRLQYMQQYASFRKKQGEEIVLQTDVLQKVKDSLVAQKSLKDSLILQEEQQKQLIENDKKEQEQLIGYIKKRERRYKRDLQKKIKEEKLIASKIDKLIKEAIARANRKAAKKSTGSKKDEFILSPEAKALASKFEMNKGKLPWPVKESIITRKFGVQPHPTLSGITINSTGLHFTTSKGSMAESIFDGEVLAIQKSTGGRKNVLVQHGNYISTYKNLESTSLKTGDKVVTGQKIGKIFTNKVTQKTTLVFVLFKNTKRLNPSQWILRR